MMLLTLVLAFAAQTVRADNVKVNINGIGTVALTHGGIRTEYYPDAAKMKKQMSYANAKQIPFVVLAGERNGRGKADAEEHGNGRTGVSHSQKTVVEGLEIEYYESEIINYSVESFKPIIKKRTVNP